MKSTRKNRLLDTSIKSEFEAADTIKHEADYNKANLYTPYKRTYKKSAMCSLETVKQEDQKPNGLNDASMQVGTDATGHGRSSSQESTARDADQIKQEDSAKANDCLAKIEHCSRQKDKDFYYRCSFCKEKQDSLQAVWQHRESVHLIKKSRNFSIKHLDLEPDVHDPNYYCQTCEKTSTSKPNFRLHLRDVHQICLKPLPPIVNRNVEPDPEDVNGHCSACNHTYASRKHYRLHLKSFHRMILAPLEARKNTDILPDWNDPDLYCASCKKTYATKLAYHSHCRQVHYVRSSAWKISISEFPDPKDPNFYCKICDAVLVTKYKYKTHCYQVHRMRSKLPDNTTRHCDDCNKTFSRLQGHQKHAFIVHGDDHEIVYPIQPEVNDMQHYCYICCRKLASKINYQRHLIYVHSMKKQDQKTKVSSSSTDSTANYICNVCSRAYSSRKSYKMHLVYAHQIKLQTTRTEYNHKQLPDPLDENYYCSACKTSYKTRRKYRTHCRIIHRLILPPVAKTFKYPDADIDIQNPNNLYCAKCDTSVKQKYSFVRHLKNIHNIILPKKGFPNPDATIDKNDPNFYCAKCEMNLSSRQAFARHIKHIHKL